MSILFSFLPLLLAILLFGVFSKLAARILRRTNLAWPHALVFGLLVFVLGVLAAFLNRITGALLPLPVALLASFLLQLCIGGWYFGPRATTQAGEPVMFRGGMMLSFLTYLLATGFGILCAIAFTLLLRGQSA